MVANIRIRQAQEEDKPSTEPLYFVESLPKLNTISKYMNTATNYPVIYIFEYIIYTLMSRLPNLNNYKLYYGLIYKFTM